MSEPVVLDLFAGCGGMSWGLHKEGFRIAAAVDEWKLALKTFAHNHPGCQVYCSPIEHLSPATIAKDLDLGRGDLDVIIGGPPCQGFSKNVPASYRFLGDQRNQLFRDYLRFVEYLRPKVVVMENVAEIFRAFDGQVTEEILCVLERLGYRTDVGVLFAPDYGVPQRRRRCFFLASRVMDNPRLPRPTHDRGAQLGLLEPQRSYVSAWQAISDLPPLSNGGGSEPLPYTTSPANGYQAEMRGDEVEVYDHVARNLSEIQVRRVQALSPGEGFRQLPANLRPATGYSGAYGRLDFESPAATITRWVFHPGSGRYYHPRDDRVITIREAARIQSFHDEFRFFGSYIKKAAQVGNAVPPRLMQAIAPRVYDCLGLKCAA